MDFVELACICVLEIKRRKNLRKRRYWVHPLLSQRLIKGQFHKIYEDLRCNREKFFGYYRMSVTSFDDLLSLVGPSIKYQNTNWRNAISPEERLSVTLRYLATGNSFQSLHYEYLIGASTIRQIVKDTCNKIWLCLKSTVMPQKNETTWREISEKFAIRTNFPNCLGAIDGKHIRIKQPHHSGSQFFNYKNFFSVVLIAVVDADYNFISVDIGSYGSGSDSTIFQNSNFGKRLEAKHLNLPNDLKLPNDNNNGLPMPFVFVADEAFTLSQNILRPYGRNNLTLLKKIFNYRLTRARRMVECAFGIFANKWRIFHRPLDVKIEFCDTIIKACCILHNYVRQKDGIKFEDTLYESPLNSINPTNTRGSHNGDTTRDYFTNYFTTPQGSVPWQYEKI